MSGTIRVRFAPSPTGHLHIGGARTALFNYLYARRQGGTFVLRLEDTDVERSTEESVQMILEDMKWLGLNWDEGPGVGGDFGPYRQTERLDIYREKVNQLLDSGDAYYCFCSAESLDSMRKQALEKNEDPKYNGACRHIPSTEAKARVAAGEPHTIRMKMPTEGETIIGDAVREKVVFENKVLDDFVLFRTNGLPTYNFAVVVDDVTMKITHVIRGDDHLSNTPRQIAVYKALNEPLPKFAHVPMILGPDKTRLSKRHGATSIGAYAKEGYLPETMINYLALLGWAFDDKTTLFSKQALEEKFSLKKVSKNPAVFDPDKLTWMNGQYMRSIDEAVYIKRALSVLRNTGVLSDKDDTTYATACVKLVREKFKLLTELPGQVDYFFQEPDLEKIDEKAREKLASMKENQVLFKALHEKLKMVESFSVSGLEESLKGFIEEKQVKFGILAHPLRVSLTGRMQSPGIFEVMEILGKEKTISRLEIGLKTAGIDI
ncbi:glutamate--tRNA ligase [bacterium]|nr:glutamate--tRNA ligase [bacterium]